MESQVQDLYRNVSKELKKIGTQVSNLIIVILHKTSLSFFKNCHIDAYHLFCFISVSCFIIVINQNKTYL